MWEELDSTTSEYWRVSLDGHSFEDLMRGCDGADNWTRSKSDFTIGTFKKLCAKEHKDPAYSDCPDSLQLTEQVLPEGETSRRIAEMRDNIDMKRPNQ